MKKYIFLFMISLALKSVAYGAEFYQCSFICGSTTGGMTTYDKCYLSESQTEAMTATRNVSVAMGCGGGLNYSCYPSSVNSSCSQSEVQDHGGLCVCGKK